MSKEKNGRVGCAGLSTDELRDYILELNGRFQIHRAFLKLAPMPGMIKDCLGRIVYMNGKAEELLGATFADLFGNTLAKFIPKSQHARSSKQDGQVLRTSEPGVFLNQFIQAEGKIIWYTVLKFAFTDDNGEKFIGWMAVDSGHSASLDL